MSIGLTLEYREDFHNVIREGVMDAQRRNPKQAEILCKRYESEASRLNPADRAEYDRYGAAMHQHLASQATR